MITKTITLKFNDGSRSTAVINGRNVAEVTALIAAEMARTGAYGFGTQSTVVHQGR
jgi:hypothetical protein